MYEAEIQNAAPDKPPFEIIGFWGFARNSTWYNRLLESIHSTQIRKSNLKYSNPELANGINDISDNTVDHDICISQPPLFSQHSPPKPSVAGSVRSSRYVGRQKSRSENEILEKELAIEMKKLEIRRRKLASCKQMLLSYDSSDDENSICGDCELGFPSSKPKAEKFVAKFNSEEMERTNLSTNQPRKGDAAGIRTAADILISFRLVCLKKLVCMSSSPQRMLRRLVSCLSGLITFKLGKTELRTGFNLLSHH
ncbi:hypothetical protein T265_03716 [Opisthorchis viverrini]|uniref:Uncharacterized protein n=1 Tax=Opisthorchis viverrini TaxID=6198 RepID=A0A075AHD6_OPIVI|nr:hypothetical protein T265_03716 [Opisthorchis viverrini]KER29699.1 hypothetical protein T265_03716 [Opisthorchis viverrini]